MATDYYQRMAGLGDAYLEGQQIAQSREEAARRARHMDLQNQQLEGKVADEGVERDRKKKYFTALDAVDAPDAAPPGGAPPGGAPAQGVTAPAATPPPAAAGLPTPAAPTTVPQGGEAQAGLPVPQPGQVPTAAPGGQAGLPAPGAPQGPPPGPDLSRGTKMSRLAVAMRSSGQPDAIAQSLKIEEQARAHNIEDTFNWGASMAKNPELRAKALAHVTQKDPTLSFSKNEKGYTILTIAEPGPDGLGKSFQVSDDQISQLMGAQALMEKGFAKEGLAGFEKVNADLANHIGVRNGLIEKTTTSNNTAVHQGEEDTSQRITANAHKTMAEAAVARANKEAKTDREADPKDVAEANRISDQLATEQDPDKRRQLITQFNAVQSKIATSLGKVKGLPPEKEIPPGTIEKVAESMVGTPIPGKMVNGKPATYDMVSAYKEAERQLKGRGDAGGGFVPKGSPADAAAAVPKAGGIPQPKTVGKTPKEAEAALGLPAPGTFADKVKGRSDAEAKAASDPRIQALEAVKTQAMRANKTVEVNNAVAKIQEIRKSYGL